MPGLQTCIDAAETFLGNFSAVSSNSSVAPVHGSPGRGAARPSCALLKKLQDMHSAAVKQEAGEHATTAHGAESTSTRLSDPSNLSTIRALLETIVVQYLQPWYPPGILAPLQKRLRLQIKPESLQDSPKDERIFRAAAHVLSTICIVHGKGLELLVRQHILQDVVLSLAVFAYSPDFGGADEPLKSVLDNSSNAAILPILMSLVQSSSPTWLKDPLLAYLSMVPLRQQGVRSIIDFAGTMTTSSDGQHQENAAGKKIPFLSLEAITRAGQLLAAVPRGMDAETYFERLSQQLHPLLDGEAGTDMAKVAAQIIGSGILGRKSTGGPGSAGWKVFVEPLHRALNPSKRRQSERRVLLTSESDLQSTITRLSTIVDNVLNPGLTRRLLASLVLPLWALYHYAITHQRTSWSDMAWKLLSVCVGREASAGQLVRLCSNISYAGPTHWHFAPGSQGGIEIRSSVNEKQDPANMIEILESVNDRATSFVKLLRGASVDDDTITELFLSSIKQWLLPDASSNSKTSITIDEEESSNLIQPFATATLVKTMVQDMPEKFVKDKNQIVAVLEPIIHNFVLEQQTRDQSRASLKIPSISNLHSIVTEGTTISHNHSSQVGNDEEVISSALSLVHMLASTSSIHETQSELYTSLRVSLKYLAAAHSTLSDSTRTSAKTILLLLSASTTTAEPSSITNPDDPTTLASERKHYIQALELITSTSSTPVDRVQGVALLNNLISAPNGPSPFIDAATVTHLLISTLSPSPPSNPDPGPDHTPDQQDDYLSAAAFNSLTLLAEHTRFTKVLHLLLIAYSGADALPRTIDTRLRLGEAIARILSSIADPSPTPDATRIAILDMPTLLNLLLSTATPPQIPHGPSPLATTLRSSALSLLATLLSLPLASSRTIPPSLTDLSALKSLAIDILAPGPAPEDAVVRRAAVLLLAALALRLPAPLPRNPAARAAAGKEAVGFVKEILTALRRVAADDVDGIVRGHAVGALEEVGEVVREGWRVAVGGEGEVAREWGARTGRLAGIEVAMPGVDDVPDGERVEGRGLIEEVE